MSRVTKRKRSPTFANSTERARKAWDDTPKPVGARVRLLVGKLAGHTGTIVRNQHVTRPAWDEDHHWVQLDKNGRQVLYAPRFVEVCSPGDSVVASSLVSSNSDWNETNDPAALNQHTLRKRPCRLVT